MRTSTSSTRKSWRPMTIPQPSMEPAPARKVTPAARSRASRRLIGAGGATIGSAVLAVVAVFAPCTGGGSLAAVSVATSFSVRRRRARIRAARSRPAKSGMATTINTSSSIATAKNDVAAVPPTRRAMIRPLTGISHKTKATRAATRGESRGKARRIQR